MKPNFTPAVGSAPMRPTHTDTTPRLSLLSRVVEPIVDQHIGQEDVCFRRIALITKHFPEDVLKKGCQTTLTVLCEDNDLKLRCMLDTGCSPNNYMSEQIYQQNILALQPYLVKCPPERVDLATSDSAQYIKEHVKLNLRHVDSRGRVRKMTLKFGILKGLRFDMVIGLYAISFHFMEVIQDLLTLQLESIEAADPALAVLYGNPVSSMLTMMSASDTDGSESPTKSSKTDSVVEDYLRNGFDMRPLDQREYMVIYDADPVEPYQPMMSAETARQAKRLADLREANNPPPARCTRSQAEQESASPDTPPVVSLQPFTRLCGDFKLPTGSNPTQSIPTRSSSSKVSNNILINKSKLANWPKKMTEIDNEAMRLNRQVNQVMAWWSQRHQSRRAEQNTATARVPCKALASRGISKPIQPFP